MLPAEAGSEDEISAFGVSRRLCGIYLIETFSGVVDSDHSIKLFFKDYR